MCSYIKFDEEFSRRIVIIHVEIEKLKRKKIFTYFYTLLSIFSGIILIIIQINILKDFDITYYNLRNYSQYSFLIFIGFVLVSMGYGKLRNHIKKTKTQKDKKKQIDHILNKYQIKYSCNIKFSRKNYGNQYVFTELKSDSDLMKNLTITLQS